VARRRRRTHKALRHRSTPADRSRLVPPAEQPGRPAVRYRPQPARRSWVTDRVGELLLPLVGLAWRCPWRWGGLRLWHRGGLGSHRLEWRRPRWLAGARRVTRVWHGDSLLRNRHRRRDRRARRVGMSNRAMKLTSPPPPDQRCLPRPPADAPVRFLAHVRRPMYDRAT